jgi:hypothetical protein
LVGGSMWITLTMYLSNSCAYLTTMDALTEKSNLVSINTHRNLGADRTQVWPHIE